MTLDGLRRLPLVDGRAPRVALLVYNDVTVDTRVLKTAASYRAAGAQVRVVAFGTFEGMATGLTTLADGVEIERLPVVELDHTLPRAGARARRMLGRLRGLVAHGTPASSDHPDVTPGSARDGADMASGGPAPAGTPAVGSGGPVAEPGAVVRARSALVTQWMRVHHTLRLWSYQSRAHRSLRRWGPDLVHANDADTLIPAWRTGRALGVPYLFDSHEIWTHRVKPGPRPVARRWEAWVERRLAPGAAGVTTVSPSIVDWLHRELRLPVPPTLVRNVPVGPAPVVSDPEATGRLRELAGLGPETQVVAYCGSITANRGIEETLDALVLLDPSVHLVLLGRGATGYRATLDARAAADGLTGRVHFVGIVPSAEVPATLRDADASVVFIRPVTLNYRYCLPNKLFESIHAGLPVVASDLPDMAEVVRGTGVGEVFDIGDAQTTADAITAVIADAPWFRAASARAAQTLTWQHEVEGLLVLAAAALDRGTPRAGVGAGTRAARRVAAAWTTHRRRLPRGLDARVDAVLDRLPDALGDRYDQAVFRFTAQDRPVPPPVPGTARRLFVAPTNYAGQGDAFARAVERHLGVGAVTMKPETTGGFSYPVDLTVPKNVYLGSRVWQRDHRSYLGRFTHVLVESGQPLFSPVSDDVVLTEVRALRSAGMQVGLLFHGTDVRLPSRHVGATPWSPFAGTELADDPRFEARAAANRRVADTLHAEGVPVFVTTPDLLADVPYARWSPVVVDPGLWQTAAPVLEREVPVVVHAPSRASIKGSDLVQPHLEALAERGVIDYRRVEGVPWAAMPRVYQEADIVLDQFRIGNYGVAACEAMAAGRLVLSHVTAQVRDAVWAQHGLELPVVETPADQVVARVEQVFADRAAFQAVAARGPAFVTAVHDGRATAAVLSELLGDAS